MKFVYLILLIGNLAQARERSVSVTGDCEKRLTPDRAAVTLVAEALDPSAGAATQKAMDQYSKIHDRVKKLNLKNQELETTEFSVSEDLEWNGNVKKSRGFRGRMGLRVVTSETGRLGEVAALASELKIQEVSGLATFVSRELQKNARENCLEEAFRDARSKAEKIAKAAGKPLGTAIQISEDAASAPTPVRAFAGEARLMKSDVAMASMAPPPIESGVAKIQVGVQVTFELQ